MDNLLILKRLNLISETFDGSVYLEIKESCGSKTDDTDYAKNCGRNRQWYPQQK